MEVINYYGENYSGNYEKERVTVRAVIVQDGMILVSYNELKDQYILPGGEKKEHETDLDYIDHEIGTDLTIESGDALVEINEYYRDTKWVARYYLAENSTKEDLKGEWIKVEELNDILRKYDNYQESDPMKRGMYMRDYMALTSLYSRVK